MFGIFVTRMRETGRLLLWSGWTGETKSLHFFHNIIQPMLLTFLFFHNEELIIVLATTNRVSPQ